MPESIAGGAVKPPICKSCSSIADMLLMNSKQWRRDHPFGFFAKPVRTPQGVLDLKKWECGVPGKEKTQWEGGLFKLDLLFPDGCVFKRPSCDNQLMTSCRISYKAPKMYELPKSMRGSHTDAVKASSYHHCFIRMSTHPAPSACRS